MSASDPWPAPGDPAAAARLLEDFARRHGSPDTALAAVLRTLGGNSPYLAELALREADQLRAILTEGPAPVADRACLSVTGASPALPRAEVARLLRQAKRRVALTAAVADIAGVWSLEQVTCALSRLADAALSLAVGHLLGVARARDTLRRGGRHVGFVALAMGKLGARALNFSSDVDLILLFDPEAHTYNADGLGAIFNRLARDLVSLMQVRDGDGTVFRLDFPPAT